MENSLKIGDSVSVGVFLRKKFQPVHKGIVKKLRFNYAEVLLNNGLVVKYAFSSICKEDLSGTANGLSEVSNSR